MAETRGQWKSKLGFILAASGSAIGLGNVVFFGSNAYTYGFGAFYLPYLLALFLVGIPVLIAELALGGMTQQGYPPSMGRVGGRWGEMLGWWALMNASFITMYYVTILAWVSGMFLGSFGALWREATPTPGYAKAEMANPQGFFFDMIASPWMIGLVVVMWLANLVVVRRGTATIEPVVKVFVPLMWVFMVLLVVRGVTLPHGEEGVFLLFTPDFEIMGDPAVWRGAVSQIFFSLTLGFGVMTAYASYLPRGSDHISNGLVTACLNCSFEYVAGLAIFSLLFAFAIVPSGGTLSMIFFVVPQGIGAMPAGVQLFGLIFFLLLLMAGLTSSVSLIEGVNCALIDKFGWSRRRTILATASVGVIGSVLFALPQVIDPETVWAGTLGFTLIDLIDHWSFQYGLLIVGLVECLMLGWLLPIGKLREQLNAHGRVRLPAAFDWMIKLVIPVFLASILVASALGEIDGFYGWRPELAGGKLLPVLCFLVWLLGSLALAGWLAMRPARAAAPAAPGAAGAAEVGP